MFFLLGVIVFGDFQSYIKKEGVVMTSSCLVCFGMKIMPQLELPLLQLQLQQQPQQQLRQQQPSSQLP